MEQEAESAGLNNTTIEITEDVMAEVETLVLPPNQKGWLCSAQLEFVKENYLQKFYKLCLEDPMKLKDYAKTASNSLIAQFSWCHFFNDILILPLKAEGPLSPPDACLKATTVGHLYQSMLSWLSGNANKIEAPMTMKLGSKAKEDLTSILLNCLVGMDDMGIKGHLPFQAWANSLSDGSELVIEFTRQQESRGLNQQEHMGLYASFFAKTFVALPMEEQAVWKERVEQEKAEAKVQQDTTIGKLGELLLLVDAMQLVDRISKIIDPVCELFAAMAGVAVCIMFGGPDPWEGGKISVTGFL